MYLLRQRSYLYVYPSLQYQKYFSFIQIIKLQSWNAQRQLRWQRKPHTLTMTFSPGPFDAICQKAETVSKALFVGRAIPPVIFIRLIIQYEIQFYRWSGTKVSFLLINKKEADCIENRILMKLPNPIQPLRPKNRLLKLVPPYNSRS